MSQERNRRPRVARSCGNPARPWPPPAEPHQMKRTPNRRVDVAPADLAGLDPVHGCDEAAGREGLSSGAVGSERPYAMPLDPDNLLTGLAAGTPARGASTHPVPRPAQRSWSPGTRTRSTSSPNSATPRSGRRSTATVTSCRMPTRQCAEAGPAGVRQTGTTKGSARIPRRTRAAPSFFSPLRASTCLARAVAQKNLR
jgi:hypothetical protein